jgi:purine-binding chemotaxis protein CheW
LASTAPTLEPAADGAADRHLLFDVGGRVYGCEIAVVREIVPFRRCTRLPGAPPYVCGLINLRGTIVTVLDLGLRFGGAAVDRSEGSVILVEHGARVVGLAVDEMRDVQRFAPDEIEAADAPSAAAGGEGHTGTGAVRGIARAGADVVVLLDVGSIIMQALL